MTAIPEPCVVSQIPYLKSLHSFHVIDVGYIKALLRRVATCRCQHIIQEVDLETPFQYLRLAYINGKFLSSGDRLTSLAFDRKTLYGVQHQIIYSHHVKCTVIIKCTMALHSWSTIHGSISVYDYICTCNESL